MTGIQPFRGTVVRQDVAHDVVSPAYDALTAEQRQQYRVTHPYSYLHVTRSADDEPDADTVDNATLVARGRRSLEAILEQELFVSHGEPAFFVYRLSLAGHTQHGLVCEIPSDYYSQFARAHEATQSARAALLAEHFSTVKAASSPIACTVRDDGDLDAELVAATSGEPVLDIAGDDGLHQTVWRIEDVTRTQWLVDRLQDVDLFIIDGHHRSAANAHLREQGHSVPVLATIFADDSLNLVGFHRLLRLPPGFDGREFLRLVSRRFRIEVTSDIATVAPGTVVMVVDGEWHIVHFDERPVSGSATVHLGALDPVVLEREVLQGVVSRLGPVDVTYMPDTEPFTRIVELAQSQGRIPLFVAPVAVADMMMVAADGVVMPAKSTYFTPKVRSGLFLRLLHELD